MGFEIDFLPVGGESQSGDAILLRFGNLLGSRAEQTIVLIDGGFRDTADDIIQHLREHFGGTNAIDLVVSTHPDCDHINGLHELVDRAAAGQLVIQELWMHRPSRFRQTIEGALRKAEGTGYTEAVRATLDSAVELEKAAAAARIPIRDPFVGVSHSSGKLHVVGPTEEFYCWLFAEEARSGASESRLMKWLRAGRDFVSSVAEGWDIETLRDDGVTSPINNSSVVLLFEWEEKLYLFTADVGIKALEQVADRLERAGYHPDRLRFIQVPHHGSRRNVGPTVLDRLLGPRRTSDTVARTAFVSAAKKGEPKHPAKKVANAFRRRGTAVHATQGSAKCHRHDAPARAGYGPSQELPFYWTVED
jgi:beta-lactamase superfamily II metal-dependent hydrolase